MDNSRQVLQDLNNVASFVKRQAEIISELRKQVARLRLSLEQTGIGTSLAESHDVQQNAPRPPPAPASPFVHFVRDACVNRVEELSQRSAAEASAMLATWWLTADMQVRAEFDKAAEDDSARYKREWTSYCEQVVAAKQRIDVEKQLGDEQGTESLAENPISPIIQDVVGENRGQWNASNSPEQSWISYIHYLEDKEIRCVLRMMSTTPRERNWSAFIEERDIDAVYAHGRMKQFAKKEFTAMCIGNLMTEIDDEVPKFMPHPYDITAISGTADDVPIDNIHGEQHNVICVSDHKVAHHVLKSAGESFVSLAVGDLCGCEPRELREQGWLEEIDKECSRVNTLLLRSSVASAWVVIFGRRLKKLSVIEPHSGCLRAIARTCVQIRQLIITSLDCDIPRDFWKRVGRKLESLRVDFFGDVAAKEELQKISKHCRKIKHIHVNAIVVGKPLVDLAWVECLISYGDQLEYVSVPRGTQVYSMTRVVAICRNVKLRIDHDGSDLSAFLKAAGAQLDSLIMHGFQRRLEIADAWSECSNLRQIDGCTVSMRFLANMFAAPKLHLEAISVSVETRNLEEADSTLIRIAKNTRALKMVQLRMRALSPLALLELVHHNRGLESIELVVEEQPTEQDTADIVQVLLTAPKLIDLRIPTLTCVQLFPVVQRICASLRRRTICIHILGIDYMK